MATELPAPPELESTPNVPIVAPALDLDKLLADAIVDSKSKTVTNTPNCDIGKPKPGTVVKGRIVLSDGEPPKRKTIQLLKTE